LTSILRAEGFTDRQSGSVIGGAVKALPRTDPVERLIQRGTGLFEWQG
jgi:hypothetical protein